MKKRFKLITTIASLCLAVALMAFGVYAAISADFKVTTTVSFDVGAHLDGTVTVTAYYSTDGTENGKCNADGTTTNVAAIGEAGTLEIVAGEATTVDGGAKITLTTGATLTQEAQYVIYVVEFEPDNGVNATASTTAVTVSNTDDFAGAAEVEGTADANKVVTYVQVTDLTADVAAANVEFTVTLE